MKKETGIKKVIGVLILVMAVFGNTVRSQIIHPLEEGLPSGNVLGSYAHDNDLYVAYSTSGDSIRRSITVSKWNGLLWAEIGKLVLINSRRPDLVLTLFNDELYMGGSFDSIAGIQGARNMIKWNGQSWTSVGGGVYSTISYHNQVAEQVVDMKEYQDKLFILGYFDRAGSLRSKNLLAWNGSFWTYPGDSQSKDLFIKSGGLNKVFQLAVYNNSLYVLGDYDSINGRKTDGIARWDGTLWRAVLSPRNFNFSIREKSAVIFGNELVIAGTDSIAGKNPVRAWNGSRWKSLSSGLDKYFNGSSSAFYSIVNSKSEIWAVGSFKDNSSGKSFGLAHLKDTSWEMLPGGRIDYAAIKTAAADSHIYLGGPFTSINYVKAKYVAEIVYNTGCLTGKVYLDSNKNGKQDKNEPVLSGRLIKVMPENDYITTDENGNYQYFSNGGSHSFTLVDKNYWRTVYPALGGYTVKAVENVVRTGLDFGSAPLSDIKDLRVTLAASQGYKSRAGYKQMYSLCYENTGTSMMAGRIYFRQDSRTSNFASTPSADYYYSPSAMWKFDSLEAGEKRCIEIWLTTDTFLVSDDSLYFLAYSDSVTTLKDTTPQDNFDSLVQIVVTSMDPNGKQCFPSGVTDPNTKEIRYNIQFQNTGKAPAVRVTVIDTIDTSLPLTEITMNSASHKYSFTIKNNVFRWTFNNIDLPDSTSDEPRSHGYISFTAKVLPGIAVGTQIRNKAYIYFDYNPAVITNETVTRIGLQTGINDEVKLSGGIYAYPNPTAGELNIVNKTNEKETLYLLNALGQDLERILVLPDENFLLNINKYPDGIYILRSDKGQTARILLQH